MVSALKFLINIVLSILYRFRTIGLKNIPKEGGAIICSNHPGTMDMFFIACRSKRLIHYMAKEELFSSSIMKFILPKVGAFPVKRGSGDIDSIKKAISILKDGKLLGILPEGTRTGKNNVKNITPKSGIALIAAKSGVPVIPAAISSDRRLFSKVKVIFGDPIYVESKKMDRAELALVTSEIMNKIYALLEE